MTSKRWREQHREQYNKTCREAHRRYIKRIRLDVLKHYSNNSFACVVCGQSDVRVLSIDHLNGNGNQHREIIKKETHSSTGSGWHFYHWLIRNNYPEGYQVLCMNCQMIKRIENNETHKIA